LVATCPKCPERGDPLLNTELLDCFHLDLDHASYVEAVTPKTSGGNPCEFEYPSRYFKQGVSCAARSGPSQPIVSGAPPIGPSANYASGSRTRETIPERAPFSRVNVPP
jgi:hypothetical protein